MEETQKAAIIMALHTCEGNRQAAARLLEIAPATLYRKMKRYQIDVPSRIQVEMTRFTAKRKGAED